MTVRDLMLDASRNDLSLGVKPHNLIAWSDPALDQFASTTRVQESVAGNLLGFAHGAHFVGDASGSIVDCALALVPADQWKTFILSVFVRMEDGSLPAPGDVSDATKDFSLQLEGDQPSSYVVTPVQAGAYRVSASFVANSTGARPLRVNQATTHSLRKFYVSGFQANRSRLTSYVATHGAPIDPGLNLDIGLVSDVEAVAQDLRTVLRLGLGEWFLTQDGLNLAMLLQTKQSDAVVLNEVRRVLKGRWGVLDVTSLTISRDRTSRTARVTFVAMTSAGRVGPITVTVGG